MARKKRARARVIALQALYQYDISGRRNADVGRALADLRSFIGGATRDAGVAEYARSLVEGSIAHMSAIDDAISRAVAHWRFERIATVDRCILRLAIFEILHVPDVPPKVSINEAIELAKKYSTAQSGAFVNGILDRIHRDRIASADGTDAVDSPTTDESTAAKNRPDPKESPC